MNDKKRAVRLRIVSEMTDPQGEKNEIKHVQRGTWYRQSGEMVIEYEDAQQDGEKGNIRLSAKPGCAQMLRRGMTSARLDFIEGQRTSSAYVTMYGEIPVAIRTKRVAMHEEEKGGELMLDYDMYVSGELTAHTRLSVVWRF